MKIEDSVPAGMLIDHMPYRGQNLVIPLTRLYTPSLGARRAQSPMPLSVAPSVSIPSGTYRPDFKEGTCTQGCSSTVLQSNYLILQPPSISLVAHTALKKIAQKVVLVECVPKGAAKGLIGARIFQA